MNSKGLTAAENRKQLLKLRDAVLSDDRTVVKHILDLGVRMPRARHFQSLVDAAKLSSSVILRLLLKAGASPDAFAAIGGCSGRSGRGWHGETALHAAVLYGPLKSIMALLNAGANVDARDNSGRCPLWYLPFRTFPYGLTTWKIETETILRVFTEAGGENVINAQRCRGMTVRRDRIVGEPPEIGIGTTLLHLTGGKNA